MATQTKTWNLSDALGDAKKRALEGRDAIEYVIDHLPSGDPITADIGFERIERTADDEPQVRFAGWEFLPEANIVISDVDDRTTGLNERLLSVFGEQFGYTLSEIAEWIEDELRVEAAAEPDTIISHAEKTQPSGYTTTEVLSGPHLLYYTDEQIATIEDAMREALAVDWGENAEIGTTSPDGSLVKISRETTPGVFDADVTERHDFHKWGAAIKHPEKGWLYENGGQSWDPYEEIANPAFPRHPEDEA